MGFAYAHKINLFITQEESLVQVHAYFANASPCKGCKLLVKSNQNTLFEAQLNEEGKYQFTNEDAKELDVIVDASSGHIVQKKVQRDETLTQHAKSVDEHIHKQHNNELYKIVLGIFVIVLLFYGIKKLKQRT
jgi:hypothetical protein